MDYKNILELGKVVANANPSAPVAYSWGEEKFAYSSLNETFAKELNALYTEDSKRAYKLMEEVITDVLPKKVMEQYGAFAEFKTFAQGDKPVFVQRITEASKRRAKQFVTKVGLAGVYEVFKLDGRSYEITTSAIGGAAQIGFEEFLDGKITMADVLDLVLEGMDETIYKEIANSLIATIDSLQDANKYAGNGFDEKEMDKLLAVADSYGPSTIYCTFEFAATMIPSEGWISDNMKDTMWNNGYLGNYKGHKVVVLQQSFTDETNTEKVINPQFAYIIPTGAQKPVKVAFEGTAHMRERTPNADWSTTVDVYQKVGVATIVTNNICIYQNKSL